MLLFCFLFSSSTILIAIRLSIWLFVSILFFFTLFLNRSVVNRWSFIFFNNDFEFNLGCCLLFFFFFAILFYEWRLLHVRQFSFLLAFSISFICVQTFGRYNSLTSSFLPFCWNCCDFLLSRSLNICCWYYLICLRAFNFFQCFSVINLCFKLLIFSFNLCYSVLNRYLLS